MKESMFEVTILIGGYYDGGDKDTAFVKAGAGIDPEDKGVGGKLTNGVDFDYTKFMEFGSESATRIGAYHELSVSGPSSLVNEFQRWYDGRQL